MVQLIREYLERRRLRKATPEAIYVARLESLAREFIATIPGPHDQRIVEAFRLARLWIAQIEQGRG